MNVWLDVTAIALMISTSLIIAIRYISSGIKWLSFQSLMLSFLTGALAIETGRTDLFVIAVLTLIIKAIIIPYILFRTLQAVGVERQAEKSFGRDRLMIAVLAMWAIGYYVTPDFGQGNGHNVYLSIAIGMLLSGVLIMITHKKALMQGVGLIVIENSLFLAALSTSFGMPFLVDIGIFMDVLVIVVLISALSFRMDELLSSMSIEKLKRLKG
ncbi:MAG: hydrogenase [Acidibacillus sp.]|uniref:Hydrogenase n=1 Tax=Sulfoacidibacillus ferrooxidans TaxID=2005001 RepID=A0A9X1V6Z9_9BACL|nr:hydrogenase [Sulfoacidibacillus ferrooxidans]MCI0182297.1 hypothetical protein [Sulfoacidibacillus ferrooxidans]MCY0893890.1 hydrogenase [Acidibacillus sp.]